MKQRTLGRIRGTEWLVAVLAVIGVVFVIAALAGGVGWQSAALEIGAGLWLSAVFVWIDRRLRADIGDEIERVEQDVDRKVAEAVATATAGLAQEVVERRQRDDRELFEAFEDDPSPATLWPIAKRVEHFGESSVGQFKHGPYSSFVLHPVDQSSVDFLIRQSPRGGTHPRHSQAKFKWTANDGLAGLVSKIHDAWPITGMYPGDVEFERFVDEDLVPAMIRKYRERIEAVLNPPESQS